MFLAPRHRDGRVQVACDGVSSLGHVVESLGVPLPEIGALTVSGRPVAPARRLAAGDVAQVGAVRRPQPVPSPRFVLDVHLGTLARRLRLVGVDAAYANDADDDALIEQANASSRVLLTQDRGLLRRRVLHLGAYVRGARPDDQLRDVLDRFAPPLAPWTRCTACNGPLAPARKADVEPLLEPGTRRTYQAFSRCQDCGRVYWRGAHSQRLQDVVDSALGIVAASRSGLAGDGPRAPAVRDLAEVGEAGQADRDGLALHEVADGELDGISGRAMPLHLERDRHPDALARHEDLVGLPEPVGQRATGRPLPADLLESAQRQHGPRRAERERLRGLV
jgi:uncharacterized protein